MTKRTRKVILGEILEIAEVKANAEYTEELGKIIAQLEKKNANKGETKTQKENAEIKKTIVAKLVELGKAVTATELGESDETLGAYSNQKLSALLNQLVRDGEIEKTTDKKKSLFGAKAE